MSKSKNKNSKSKIQNPKFPLKWIVVLVVVLISASLFYWINYAKPKSKENTEKNIMPGADPAIMAKATQLTQEVFRYVELVETKKMTQEQADKESGPIKAELQQLRNQMNQAQIAENDSIRKAFGDIMVANVMKWRKENLPPVDE